MEMLRTLPVDADLPPIAVDLDGTLLRTDTLHEGLVEVVFRHPRALPGLAGALLRGRAAFKRQVGRAAPLDAGSLPVREELRDWLVQQRAAGHRLHLVTAADQSIADSVASATGLFDEASGSDGRTNLSGAAKAAFLTARYPDGFIYCGDSAPDAAVFAASEGIVLAGAPPGLAARARRMAAPVVAEFADAPPRLQDWRRAARLHQWSKNLLIFVPLFLGHKLGAPVAVLHTILGFFAMSVAVSGTYLLNDLSDLRADRVHPTKFRRPFAAGRIPVSHGLVGAVLMLLAGLAAAVALQPGFALALLAYIVTTLTYSFSFKRVPLLDTLVIAGLFTLRVVAGVELAQVPYSPWLLSFSAFFFLSLGLAKRHVEVLRGSEASLARRGYTPADWPLTLAFGVGAGLVALQIIILYVANDVEPSRVYRHAGMLYVVPVMLAAWLARIWLLAHRRELNDDPVVFALRDRRSWVIGAVIAGAVALAL
jgi:4-hydroxybenzoate polyprenyltransferase